MTVTIDQVCFTKDFPKGTKICVTGAGGFIASHLSKRLKAEGHTVRGVDWKENEYMAQEDFCDEFMNLDLRFPENCAKAVEGMDWCFNLAVHAPRTQCASSRSDGTRARSSSSTGAASVIIHRLRC